MGGKLDPSIEFRQKSSPPFVKGKTGEISAKSFANPTNRRRQGVESLPAGRCHSSNFKTYFGDADPRETSQKIFLRQEAEGIFPLGRTQFFLRSLLYHGILQKGFNCELAILFISS
jgi:hypothetical protein